MRQSRCLPDLIQRTTRKENTGYRFSPVYECRLFLSALTLSASTGTSAVPIRCPSLVRQHEEAQMRLTSIDRKRTTVRRHAAYGR